ncbi:fatty-acid--CoA ligase, partial [Acinetobacter baumannii]
GGENVYSREVEEVIYSYPGVAQCAVIGIPDPRWGEAVHAIVAASHGAAIDAEALMAHCRTRIAGYKCPRSIDVRADPLPLNGAN